LRIAAVPAREAENVMMMRPQVRVLGDKAAIICYIKLQQSITRWVGLVLLLIHVVFLLELHLL